MTVFRWNFEKKKYETYKIPDGWKVSMIETDDSTVVNCASCGNKIEYGDSYTSMMIHNRFGMSYVVCRECYLKECYKRRIHGKE